MHSAVAVHLEASATLELKEMVFPTAWKPVVVHTRVLLQDGSSPANANLNARLTQAQWSVEPAMGLTDSEGKAALTVYDGQTYYLTADINGGTQQRCGGPLRFAARDGLVLDAIVIEHNWGNRLAQLNPAFRAPR